MFNFVKDRIRPTPQFHAEELPSSTPSSIVESEEGVLPLFPWIPQSYKYILSTADEEGTNLKFFSLLHDEPWTAQYTISPWLPLSFTDDEIQSGLKNFALEQEEAWTARDISIPWTSLPFQDDEIQSGLKNFQLEQEEGWEAHYTTNLWLSTSFTNDEIIGTPITNLFDQEEGWEAHYTTRLWDASTFQDDESTGAHLAYFGLEQEEPWTPQYETVLWSSTNTIDDDLTLPLSFGIDQEEPWLPQQQDIPWWARIFFDDDTWVAFVKSNSLFVPLNGNNSMAIKNQALVVEYLAWNIQLGQGQTGDAANHTLRCLGNGVEFTPASSPVEGDSTNLKGSYKLALSAAEMNYGSILLGGTSSTPNVVLVPILITTVPSVPDPLANLTSLYPSGTGGAALNKLAGGTIIVTAPISTTGDVTLFAGDSYYAVDGRAIIWTNVAGTWPDLTGATCLLTTFPTFPASSNFISAVSILVPVGANQQLKLELSTAQTTGMVFGAYPFTVVATLPSGHVCTLVDADWTVSNH